MPLKVKNIPFATNLICPVIHMCYIQKSYISDATLDESSELFPHREVIGPGTINVTFATFEILPYSTNLLFNMG